MAYAEYRPAAELADLVVCTWERTVPRHGAAPTRVLPDGCVDVVWSGGELFTAGPDTGPVISPVAPGDTIVGLRFRPGVAGAALGLPASELRDLRPALDDVWGTAAAELAGRVGDAVTPAAQRGALERFVLERRGRIEEPDALVLEAVRRLGRPDARVAGLSGALGISERQLLRRFAAAVGYGPKLLQRVLRFQRLVSLAPATEDGFARLAADLGYADQAHMSRDCARLAGVSPTRLSSDLRTTVPEWQPSGR